MRTPSEVLDCEQADPGPRCAARGLVTGRRAISRGPWPCLSTHNSGHGPTWRLRSHRRNGRCLCGPFDRAPSASRHRESTIEIAELIVFTNEPTMISDRDRQYALSLRILEYIKIRKGGLRPKCWTVSRPILAPRCAARGLVTGRRAISRGPWPRLSTHNSGHGPAWRLRSHHRNGRACAVRSTAHPRPHVIVSPQLKSPS
jgi:hypothetical protein